MKIKQFSVVVLCGSTLSLMVCGCSEPAGMPVHTTLADPPGIIAQRINGPGPRYDNGEPDSPSRAQQPPERPGQQ